MRNDERTAGVWTEEQRALRAPGRAARAATREDIGLRSARPASGASQFNTATGE